MRPLPVVWTAAPGVVVANGRTDNHRQIKRRPNHRPIRFPLFVERVSHRAGRKTDTHRCRSSARVLRDAKGDLREGAAVSIECAWELQRRDASDMLRSRRPGTWRSPRQPAYGRADSSGRRWQNGTTMVRRPLRILGADRTHSHTRSFEETGARRFHPRPENPALPRMDFGAAAGGRVIALR